MKGDVTFQHIRTECRIEVRSESQQKRGLTRK